MFSARRLLLSVVTIFTVASEVRSAVSGDRNENVCTSKECARTASLIQKSMDPSVDPCTNFYKFSCGGFIRSTEVPKTEEYIDFEREVLINLSEDVQRMLDEPMDPEAPKHLKLIKTLYASCMNPASMGQGAVESLHNFLKKFGGWPVVEGDSWDESKFDWRSSIIKFKADGDAITPLINVRPYSDLDGSPAIIELSQVSGIFGPVESSTDLPYSFEDEYSRILLDIAVALGANPTSAPMEISKLIRFEKSMMNITLTDDELEDLEPEVTDTIAALSKEYPTVPWMTYITNFLGPNTTVPEDTIVVVYNPDYYVSLEALMAETPKRVQANLVISRLAMRNAIYSSENMRIRFYEYLTEVFGLELDMSRESFCRSQVLANLWLGFMSTAVRKYYDYTAVNHVKMTAFWIAEQWKKTSAKMNLVDKDVRELVVDEAKMNFEAYSYPPELLNTIKLEQFYSNLEFTTDFFENMERLSSFDHNLWLKELITPFDSAHWTLAFDMTSINPALFLLSSYIPISPKLAYGVPASGMQPQYVRYGAIGWSLAYGMSFHDDWLNEHFSERAHCLIDHLKRNISIGEDELEAKVDTKQNIASLVGSKVAYAAYMKWASKNRNPEPKLPGLEKYSSRQMFWITLAKSQCVKYREESEIAPNSGITPVEFRVTNAIANIKQFAEDFNCPANAPMRGNSDCSQW